MRLLSPSNIGLAICGGMLAGIALGHDHLLNLVRYGLAGQHPWDNAAPGTAASVQLTQYWNWATPDAPMTGKNGNCGPASVLMGVRLLGRDLPGMQGEHSYEAIMAARAVAYAGAPDPDVAAGTTFRQMQHIASAAGIASKISTSTSDLLAAVEHGNPVVLAGAGNKSLLFSFFGVGGPKIGSNPGGTHAVLLSSYDRARDSFEVLDPGADGGPLWLTRVEVEAFSVSEGLILHRLEPQQPPQRTVLA